MRGTFWMAIGLVTVSLFIGRAALIKAAPISDPSSKLLQNEQIKDVETRQNYIPQYQNNLINYQTQNYPSGYYHPYPVNNYNLQNYQNTQSIPQYPYNQLSSQNVFHNIFQTLTGNRPQNVGQFPLRPHHQPYAENARPESSNGLMDILESVALNDELQCVPKILCEMTSGNRGQTGKPAQSFINLDSVLTLLSSVDDASASPIVKFGKAFLLGYTSRHVSSCQYAYPRCPSDPDRLIYYLNNQNGGLFRFFNGVTDFNKNPYQNRNNENNPKNVINNLYNFYYNLKDEDNRDKKQYAWKFPLDNEIHNYENDEQGDSRRGKLLKFPKEETIRSEYTQSLLPFYFPDSFFLSGHKLNSEISEKEENSFVFKDT